MFIKSGPRAFGGNIAMFLICMILGYFLNDYVGYAGFVGGAFATIVEKFERINDNISIPFGSAVLMTLLRML